LFALCGLGVAFSGFGANAKTNTLENNSHSRRTKREEEPTTQQTPRLCTHSSSTQTLPFFTNKQSQKKKRKKRTLQPPAMTSSATLRKINEEKSTSEKAEDLKEQMSDLKTNFATRALTIVHEVFPAKTIELHNVFKVNNSSPFPRFS
jgi:hypothetical protein